MRNLAIHLCCHLYQLTKVRWFWVQAQKLHFHRPEGEVAKMERERGLR